MSFQAYIDNIKAKTGKLPEDFQRLAAKKGILKPGLKATELVAWLKKDFDLGHGHAMAIFTVFKMKGWLGEKTEKPAKSKSTQSSAAAKTTKTTKAEKPVSGKETKASDPDAVNAFLKKLKHPMLPVAEALRSLILKAEKSIGEEIYWNAPCFFYTGPLKPFKPKEYKRVIVVFNFYKKDCLRIIFLRGALAKDKTGFLEGDYADGRRIASFTSMQDVRTKEKQLDKVLKLLVKAIKED